MSAASVSVAHQKLQDRPARGLDVSVCIVNWNTQGLLRACLRSVQQFSANFQIELLVADNASSDGSPEMVEAEFPDVRLWRNIENVGFARANNQLIREATGEFILLLNSDAELHPGTLQGLVQFLRSHPRAAACSPKLVNQDGRVQAQGQSFPSLGRLFKRCIRAHFPPIGPLLVRRSSESVVVHEENTQVDIISGAAMLVRKAAFDDVGLLNESLHFYGEEADLGMRFRQNGWQNWYVPQVSAFHMVGASSKKNTQLDTSWQLTRGQIVFIRNYHGRISALIGLCIALFFYIWSLCANAFRLVVLFPWRGSSTYEIRGYAKRIMMAIRFFPEGVFHAPPNTHGAD